MCTSEWECACTKESTSQRSSICMQWRVALVESMLTACLISHLAKRTHRSPQNILKSTFLMVYAFIFWLYTEQPMRRVSFISQSSLDPKQIEKTFVLLSTSFFQLDNCLYKQWHPGLSWETWQSTDVLWGLGRKCEACNQRWFSATFLKLLREDSTSVTLSLGVPQKDV